MARTQHDEHGIRILNRGRLTCPNDQERLSFEQYGGMRLFREYTPPKPKHKYKAFTAMCDTCHTQYKVKI